MFERPLKVHINMDYSWTNGAKRCECRDWECPSYCNLEDTQIGTYYRYSQAIQLQEQHGIGILEIGSYKDEEIFLFSSLGINKLPLKIDFVLSQTRYKQVSNRALDIRIMPKD